MRGEKKYIPIGKICYGIKIYNLVHACSKIKIYQFFLYLLINGTWVAIKVPKLTRTSDLKLLK